MGGRKASNGYGNSRFFIIFMKNPHFWSCRGGDQGGAHGGAQKWRGEWVGEFSHTWWGDKGALQTPVSQLVAPPPSAPPWCGIQNFEIWHVNIKWNQKSWFLDTYSCFYDYIRIHMRIFAVLSIWELIWDVQNSSPNSKNRWFWKLRSMRP